MLGQSQLPERMLRSSGSVWVIFCGQSLIFGRRLNMIHHDNFNWRFLALELEP
jgi:hypothetical protein